MLRPERFSQVSLIPSHSATIVPNSLYPLRIGVATFACVKEAEA